MDESTLLRSTSQDDLKALISEAVSEGIKKIPIPTPPEQIEYLTRKEVCKLLQVSPVTLNEWTKTGIIKGYRLNSRVRYKRADIESSLLEVKSLKYRRGRP